MKEKKIYNCCEYCNKEHKDVSPPTKDQYKQGLICIGEFSSILLDNFKSGKSHSKSLQGIFCNADCLTKFIIKSRCGK